MRVISCTSALGAALLLGGAGCGSRTSTLDQEAYLGDGSMPFAGQSSGGAAGQAGSPSRGGSPGVPTAGSSSMPIAGQANAPSDTVTKTCQSYCSGYATKCPGQLMGQNCQQACQQEMSGYGERCQRLGLKALKCLAPFFKKDAPSCDAAIAAALSECGAHVEGFQECKGIDQPTPTPNPPEPSTCASVEQSGANSCRTTFVCANNTYTVACEYWSANPGPGAGGASAKPRPPTYNCVCSEPNGARGLMLSALSAPCAAAAEACGFTIGQLK